VVKTLVHRADSIVSDEAEKVKEKEHIRVALKINGYPDWLLDQATPRKEKQVEEIETVSTEIDSSDQGKSKVKPQKRTYPVVLPYIRGFSEQLRRVFKHYNIPAFFKPSNTLRQLLVRPKDKLDKDKVVGPVYHIQCDDCEAGYVGETERSLKARFMEHRRPSTVTSEVSRHVHVDEPDHSVSLESARILAVEPRWFEPEW
jgi:hypothetical protein